MTFLSSAASKGWLRVMNKLLLINPSEHSINEALIRAVEQNHIDCVRGLLNAGADPYANHDKAIYRAIAKGYVDILDILMTHNDANLTLLYWAINYGHIGVVRLLIRRGGDVNNALTWAVQKDNVDIAQELLFSGAKINYNIRQSIPRLCPEMQQLILTYDTASRTVFVLPNPSNDIPDCGICLESCDTVYKCCGAPVHQKCGQQWINSVFEKKDVNYCYQRCDGDTI